MPIIIIANQDSIGERAVINKTPHFSTTQNKMLEDCRTASKKNSESSTSPKYEDECKVVMAAKGVVMETTVVVSVGAKINFEHWELDLDREKFEYEKREDSGKLELESQKQEEDCNLTRIKTKSGVVAAVKGVVVDSSDKDKNTLQDGVNTCESDHFENSSKEGSDSCSNNCS